MVLSRFNQRWSALKGTLLKRAFRQRWGDLTEEELDQAEGGEAQLVELLQQKYGYTEEKAENEVAEFVKEHR